jgi:hypothetical protein
MQTPESLARLCGNLSIPDHGNIYNGSVAKRKKIPALAGKCALKLLILLISASAIAQRGPEPGQRIPTFRLPDQHGGSRSFENLKGPKGLVLVFYRSSDW